MPYFVCIRFVYEIISSFKKKGKWYSAMLWCDVWCVPFDVNDQKNPKLTQHITHKQIYLWQCIYFRHFGVVLFCCFSCFFLIRWGCRAFFVINFSKIIRLLSFSVIFLSFSLCSLMLCPLRRDIKCVFLDSFSFFIKFVCGIREKT